jgi:hypothetical protein
MCVQSKLIPLRELWDGFNPRGVDEGLFLMFRGYIDESYDSKQNVFAWSCLTARGKDWREIERKWKLHLAAKNKALKKEGRTLISRYHASDCSGRRGEFEGWSHDERDAFVLGLFGIFKQVPTFTVAYDWQLEHVWEVFPEWKHRGLEAAYHFLTVFMMITIGKDYKRFLGRGWAMTLFHDRTAGNGEYDPAILRAFNQMMNDPTFSYKENFTTIAPLSWEQCIALQPADLVAFEWMKQAEARLESRTPRKSLTALLNMEMYGIHSKTVGKPALEALRQVIEKPKP